jgi:hypothetical protein
MWTEVTIDKEMPPPLQKLEKENKEAARRLFETGAYI